VFIEWTFFSNSRWWKFFSFSLPFLGSHAATTDNFNVTFWFLQID
jgi:hypothetical protein